jgi:hypothetical protein
LIGNTLLCIETDENQHKGYDKEDEELGMTIYFYFMEVNLSTFVSIQINLKIFMVIV